MDVLVWGLVWSVAILTHTPSLKESHISNRELVPFSLGASTDSSPTLTSILTVNHVINTKPNTDSTAIIQPPESVTSTNATQDFTESPILLRSTTLTPGSSNPLSTNLSEEHQNSAISTTSEMTLAVSLIPPSLPASTLKDLITGSTSLEKENQARPSELDVGDEDLDRVPSPSPLDPLLAGLISIFIISTAMLSIMLFLKFRQQSSHPEFHRLQDVPMAGRRCMTVMMMSPYGSSCRAFTSFLSIRSDKTHKFDRN
ncbi:flocculation protein FLO11-like [Silurus meridionalis]|nr:flocculation protein FLO11-like [Silurus meridionalis]